MEAQQELFTELLLRLRASGYDVYDGMLPPEDTPYPFVYLGECRQADAMTKKELTGTVYQTIHVWHNNPGERGTVSAMLSVVKQVCVRMEHTGNFGWMCRNPLQRIIPDNTTKTPLLHGILEAEFKFSRR